VTVAELARVAIGLLGLALVIVGLAWRAVRARRARVRLARTLTSDNPDIRREAASRLRPRDLRHFVDELTWVLASETDPRLLEDLAHFITDDPWKLTDPPALTRLRLAAHWQLLETTPKIDEPDVDPTHQSAP
jgi:hypothetical protein